MPISKIEGLDCSYYVDELFFHLSFTGLIDSVRKAVREVVFGLGLLGGIEARCEYRSETYESVSSGDFAEIKISIGLMEFDRIILLFRYCNHIGVNIPLEKLYLFNNGKGYSFKINESTVGRGSAGGYLAAAKQVANGIKEPPELKNYGLPTNRNFWLKEEIDNYNNKEYSEYKNNLIKNLSFFKLNPSNPEAKLNLIRASQNHIVTLVENMVNSHPENLFNCNIPMGHRYLVSYANRQGHIKNYSELLTNNPKFFKGQFCFIRDEDIKEFMFLANKYTAQKKQIEELESLKQINADQPLNIYRS